MAIIVNEKNAIAFFAENPYNVLGLPCTAQKHDIAHAVSELRTAIRSNSFHLDSIKNLLYVIDAKFYTHESVSDAFSKLSNINSKVFAFNSPNYIKKFTLNDISTMLDTIECYDEFLAGYLWLIENDTKFSHKGMWGKLCNHIDFLMEADESEWQGYFDNRLSLEELTECRYEISDFYNAFCEDILRPLKSITGDNSSQSAREILFNQMSTARVNNYIGGDNELLNLINQVESQSDYQTELDLQYSQQDISLVDDDKEVEAATNGPISLLGDRKQLRNESASFYHLENSNMDIEKTSKENQFTAKLSNSDYKENYNKMEALDVNAPRQQLIKPKISTAEQMTGLIIDGENVKEVVNNSDGYIPNKRQMRKDTNLNDFERIQFEQKENKRKSKNLGLIALLLVVAIVGYFVYVNFIA